MATPLPVRSLWLESSLVVITGFGCIKLGFVGKSEVTFRKLLGYKVARSSTNSTPLSTMALYIIVFGEIRNSGFESC